MNERTNRRAEVAAAAAAGAELMKCLDKCVSLRRLMKKRRLKRVVFAASDVMPLKR